LEGLRKILETSRSRYYEVAVTFVRQLYAASSAPFVAFLAALLCGCGRSEQHADLSQNDSEGASRQEVPVVRDGFEGVALAAFWLPGNYGSGLHTPDAIRLTTNFARSGAYAAQITIHQGDIAAAGDADTTVERDELDSGHYRLMGREAWYGFSFLIPKDFPIVDVRLVISHASNPTCLVH
jgi:hypothetical protein